MVAFAAASGALAMYLLVGTVLGVTPLRLPRRSRRFEIRNWLAQGGMSLSPTSFVALSAGFGLAAGFATRSLSGSSALGLVVGIAATVLPAWRVARKRAGRLAAAAAAWPDALRGLATTLRSGGTLPGGLAELAVEGGTGLRTAFAGFESLAAVFGSEVALEIIRQELADPVSDRVIEVLITSLERGGPLVPGLLNEVALATSEDLHVAAEIVTNNLEQTINARVVIAIPWLVLVLLTIGGGPMRDFYQSNAGTAVIAVAAALSAIGLGVMVGLGRVPIEQRLFAPTSRELH